jgi:hypothetical protein
MAAVVAAIAGGAALVAVLATKGSSSNQGNLRSGGTLALYPTLSPTNSMAPTPAYAVEFRDQLPSSTIQRIEDDPASPQAKAFQFVLSTTPPPPGGGGGSSLSFHRHNQRMGLATLYFSTTVGSKWTNDKGWLRDGHNANRDDLHECAWAGCNCKTNAAGFRTAVEIELHDNGLAGTIPPEVGLLLTDLQKLELDGNRGLIGTIPTELALLTRLSSLALNSGNLTGTIPPELGTMSALSELNLFGNALTGTIPPDLASATALSKLLLNTNRLSGTIPSSLGALSKLVTLDVAINDSEVGRSRWTRLRSKRTV